MAGTIPERADVQEGHKWDLSPLFSSDEKWDELFSVIEAELPRYEIYRGRLGESAAVLKEVIEFDLAVMRKVERLYTYAHLKSDEDKSNQRYQGLYQRATNLYTRASEISSYIAPEIQSVPDDVMNGFLRTRELDDYRFLLEKYSGTSRIPARSRSRDPGHVGRDEPCRLGHIQPARQRRSSIRHDNR